MAVFFQTALCNDANSEDMTQTWPTEDKMPVSSLQIVHSDKRFHLLSLQYITFTFTLKVKSEPNNGQQTERKTTSLTCFSYGP